jgi:hypothetical protein
MVNGDVKLAPDAGDRGLGTATAANAEHDVPRTRMMVSIRLAARVLIACLQWFKGDGQSFGPEWNDSAD